MTQEEIYRDLKQLKKYPEWVTFVAHVDGIAQIHRDSSVQYSAKAKADDAQRQAWIAEGLIEALEEPERFIKGYEFSVKGLFKRVCQLCGTVFDKAKA